MEKFTNWVVRVDFLDHSSVIGGIASPAVCAVVGVAIEDNDSYLVLSNWMCDGSWNDPDNSDTHCIVKQPGIKITKLTKA